MHTSNRCHQCGTPFSPITAEGLCLACLLDYGLRGFPDEEAEGIQDVEQPADFSPDGRVVAVVQLRNVQLIALTTGEELATLPAPDPARSVFS